MVTHTVPSLASEASRLESPVAIVGYIRDLKIKTYVQSTDQESINALMTHIESVLTEANISLTWLESRQCTTVIGLNDSLNQEEPFLVGSHVSRRLGLSQTGLTVEAGNVSGMAALHLAKTRLLTGNSRFGLMVSLVCDHLTQSTRVNIILLQSLGEALNDGFQIHGLIKDSVIGRDACAETLLNECCQKSTLQRDQVLRVESGHKCSVSSMLAWIDGCDDELVEEQSLSIAGFSSYDQVNGTRVSLLLQAPHIAPQMGADAEDEIHESYWDEVEADDVLFDHETYATAVWELFCSGLQGQNNADASKSWWIGRTALGLQWPKGEDSSQPMFLSFQQGLT